MKKTSLRSYIFFFLSLIMVIMSLSFFLLFRFSAQEYIDAMARQQMSQKVKSTEKMLEISAHKKGKVILPDSVMLYNDNHELVYPKKPGARISELSEKYQQYSKDGKNIPGNQPFVLNTETRDYLLKITPLEKNNDYDASYLVVYTTMYNDGILFHHVETLVLLITLALAVIFTPILWFFSGRLVQPLRQLQLYAEQVGNGDFRVPRINSPIAEVEHLSATFSAMAHSLEESVEAQKTFFQNASHELRTPLMSIEGYAQGIQDGIFTDPSMAADVIISESERMKQLIDGILTLSRLDAGEQKLYPADTNIHTLITQLLLRFDGIIKNRKKETFIECESDDLYVYCDPLLLEKACANLLSNALRCARTKIWITLSGTEEHVFIAFENDGPLLSEQEKSKIFARFYKGEKGAFGIGLSIVSSALEYIGGEITADNKTRGACFTITLKKEKQVKTALPHD